MHIYTANKKGKIPFDHYYYLYLRPCKFTYENNFFSVFHRLQNGHFKSIQAMENLPFWQGKAYTRFVQRNNL